MNDKLSVKELKTLYNELMPMFQYVLKHSSGPSKITDIIRGDQRGIAQQIRNQRDKEDNEKIRRSLW